MASVAPALRAPQSAWEAAQESPVAKEARQKVEGAAAATQPAGHKQLDTPASALNVPAGHGAHAVAPAEEKLPAGQGVHAEGAAAPAKALYVPAVQGRHAAEEFAPSAGEKVPAGQLVQELAPLLLKVPVGHSEQTVPCAMVGHMSQYTRPLGSGSK